MQHIQHELSVGLPQRGLDLYCNIGLDGRHLYRMKCDSFVGQFIRDLYGHVTGGVYDALYNPDWNGRVYPRTIGSISWDTVESMMKISSTGSLFDWEDSSEFAWAPGEDPVYALIWGCQSVPALNGFWQIGQRSGTTDWWLPGLTTDISAGHLADDGQVILKRFARRAVSNLVYPLRNWEAVVGAGTRPVSAGDMSLATHLGGLSEGAVTVSPLITDQQSSKFNISRAFTNTGGADLSVNEIGIQTGRQDEFTRTPYTLLARDVLEAPLALPATKTLTLDYEILTQIENFNQDTALHGSNGGFTEAFTSMLRSLAVSDNSDSYHTQFFLSLFPGGGGGYMERSGNPIPGWKFGIRLGESSKFVSMTDTDLSPDATDQTPYDVGGIAHGTGDGLLVHHGMVADDGPVIDLEANEAWFNLHRIFENKGSTAITVKEIGIYGNSKSTYNYDFTPALIARRALAPADQFTIHAGQAIQVTFTIKAVV